MREFLVRHLRRIPGKTLDEAIESAFVQRRPGRSYEFRNHLDGGGTAEGFIDTADFDFLISLYWNDVFREVFRNNREIQTECHVIANARNDISHPDENDRGTEETRAALLFVARALGRLNRPDEQRQVQRLLDGIVDPKVGELAAEVGQLTLKMNEQNTALEGLENELDRAVSVLEHATEAVQDALEALAGNLEEILERLSSQQIRTDADVGSIRAFAENLNVDLSQITARLDDREEDEEEEDEEEEDEEEEDEEEEDEEEEDEEEEDEEEEDEEEEDEEEEDEEEEDEEEEDEEEEDEEEEDEEEEDEEEEDEEEEDEEEEDEEEGAQELRLRLQVREQLQLPWISPAQTSIRRLLTRELGIMPTARFYCTRPDCRFTDGTRKAWYNENKARSHAQITGHAVQELPQR